MNYEEFQRHIGKAGLKLNEFARLMKMNPKSISNKRTRGVPWHLAVIAVLLGELGERGIDFRTLLANVDSDSSAGAEPDQPPSRRGDGGKE